MLAGAIAYPAHPAAAEQGAAPEEQGTVFVSNGVCVYPFLSLWKYKIRNIVISEYKGRENYSFLRVLYLLSTFLCLFNSHTTPPPLHIPGYIYSYIFERAMINMLRVT